MQKKSHINKGLIVAAVLISFNMMTHFTNTNFKDWSSIVFGAIIIIGIFISVYLFSKEVEQEKTFSTLFSYGFKVTAVVACVFFIYNILAVYIFFPNFIEESIKRQVIDLKKTGPIDEKGLQENMEKAKSVARAMYFAFTLMSTLFLGIIGSLISTVASLKNNNN